ncbi:hypothetical protein LLG39_00965 [bacterium]|nr:hypothetical protein [bacterium]
MGEYGDKAIHCLVSCQLIKECGFSDVTTGLGGILKEVGDAFGKGADFDDWAADKGGIGIGNDPNASCSACLSPCSTK